MQMPAGSADKRYVIVEELRSLWLQPRHRSLVAVVERRCNRSQWGDLKCAVFGFLRSGSCFHHRFHHQADGQQVQPAPQPNRDRCCIRSGARLLVPKGSGDPTAAETLSRSMETIRSVASSAEQAPKLSKLQKQRLVCQVGESTVSCAAFRFVGAWESAKRRSSRSCRLAEPGRCPGVKAGHPRSAIQIGARDPPMT